MRREAMASARKENATSRVKGKCLLKKEREKKKILANNIPKYLKCEARIKKKIKFTEEGIFLKLKKNPNKQKNPNKNNLCKPC